MSDNPGGYTDADEQERQRSMDRNYDRRQEQGQKGCRDALTDMVRVTVAGAVIVALLVVIYASVAG